LIFYKVNIYQRLDGFLYTEYITGFLEPIISQLWYPLKANSMEYSGESNNGDSYFSYRKNL